MREWLAGAMLAAALLIGAFAVLFAQGAPTTPTAQLYTPINPTSSQQQFEVTFNSGVYSVVAPNAVWGLGMHYVYTATESASNGASYDLGSNASSAPLVGASAGGFYQLNDALTLYGLEPCSGAACAGVTETLTISVYMEVVTPFKSWLSGTATYVWSSAQAGCVTGVPCPPVSPANAPTTGAHPTRVALDTFLVELLVPVALLAGMEFMLAYGIFTRMPALAVAGVASFALAAFSYLAFGVWMVSA